MTEHEMAAKKPAFHKLVQRAPNGRDTLFIAAHAKRIVGLPEYEGLSIITGLINHCTQPQVSFSPPLRDRGRKKKALTRKPWWGREQYCLALKWKNVGYLVWWDNRQSMHRATTFSDQMERRDMRRTTVFDDGESKDGVDVGGIGSMPAT